MDVLSVVMDDLRACVCAALGTPGDLAGAGDVCVCTLMPGQQAPADWCSCSGRNNCGMAWVRLDRLYPSLNFPAQDQSTKTSCASVLAAVFEVGAYRCRTVQSSTTPVPPETRTNEALQSTADAMALYRAITCCESVTKRPNLLGLWQPRDGGDCGGGAWQVTVQLLRR